MTTQEALMRTPVIKMLAAGESWGGTARRLKVAPGQIEAWWLAYERRCGEIGRAAALTELGVADAA